MTTSTHVAFRGTRLIARGSLPEVAAAAWDADQGAPAPAPTLAFDVRTGRQIELVLGGSRDDAIRWAGSTTVPAPAAPRGRGRPKLGVVGREVTLLPTQWAWLERQPGSSSAVLRRLVHEAMNGAPPTARRGAEAFGAADTFLRAFAGELPGSEEATRALYRGDRDGFVAGTAGWPDDVRGFALELAEPGFAS